MRLLKTEYKKGNVKVAIEDPEDLWTLSHLIEHTDKLRAGTERKLKIGGEDARNQKVVRKKMTLTITVEKCEFSGENLRVLGVITEGPDDVPRGEHHSIKLTPGDHASIIKKEWASWQIEKLKEASTEKKESILVVLFDREEALFAHLSRRGHKILSRLKGDVQKKGDDTIAKGGFWKAIARQLGEYNTRHKPNTIIAASPAFWKDYLKDTLHEDIAKKTIYAQVSGVEEGALKELAKRPELVSALSADREAKEETLTQKLLAALAKEKASYGIKEVQEKAKEGALSEVMVSENFLQQVREENSYEQLDMLLKTAEGTGAKIHIITHVKEQIDGLGGIAAISRW